MSGNQANEVDEVIKELKKNKGFHGFVIMNNDGIVIRREQMEYKAAVHHAYLVLDLCSKAKDHVRQLFEAPDVILPRPKTICTSLRCNARQISQNEIDSLRLKTSFYEMIISQHANFTLVAIQMEEAVVPKEAAAEAEEKKVE